jgi:hypothetical protein
MPVPDKMFVAADSVVFCRRGGDGAAAAWHPVSNLPPLAFDHEDVVRWALERL